MRTLSRSTMCTAYSTVSCSSARNDRRFMSSVSCPTFEYNKKEAGLFARKMHHTSEV